MPCPVFGIRYGSFGLASIQWAVESSPDVRFYGKRTIAAAVDSSMIQPFVLPELTNR